MVIMYHCEADSSCPHHCSCYWPHCVLRGHRNVQQLRAPRRLQTSSWAPGVLLQQPLTVGNATCYLRSIYKVCKANIANQVSTPRDWKSSLGWGTSKTTTMVPTCTASFAEGTAPRNRLTTDTLDYLIRIFAEGPELHEFNFEHAVSKWNAKCHRRLLTWSTVALKNM